MVSKLLAIRVDVSALLRPSAHNVPQVGDVMAFSISPSLDVVLRDTMSCNNPKWRVVRAGVGW